MRPRLSIRARLTLFHGAVVACALGACVNVYCRQGSNLFFDSHGGTEPWTKHAVEFTTPADTNQGEDKAYVRLFFLNADGSAWFDDVRLREAD